MTMEFTAIGFPVPASIPFPGGHSEVSPWLTTRTIRAHYRNRRKFSGDKPNTLLKAREKWN